ncbi:MAG: M48 family metallopeptidase [Spirochaetia bacterium]|nr:M48 family metallopeptidase [Spirochaetia bacterium]
MNVAINFSNPFVLIFLIGSVLSFAINQFLEFIDYKARVKNGGNLPSELAEIPLAKETFDEKKLAEICKYENAKYFAWIPKSICSLILNLALVVFGFYPFVFNLICLWTGFPSSIGNSFFCFLLFTIVASVPGEILGIPFELYREFNLEKRFGFSKMTVKLWITDQLKNLAVSFILSCLLTIVASVFFVKCPDSWWFILAALLIAFTFIMQVVYPKFIAPLFNKFEPLPEGEVKDKIMGLLDKTGFKNGGLFQMDASKRSGHSNAYFTGFGKSKRIVLFDTLINQMSADELEAVLGHELGHFKLKHIAKKLIFTIPLEFVLLFGLYKLSQFTSLYTGFGFNSVTVENVGQVQFIGLFLALTLYESISEIISPVANIFSRKDEYAADAFSAKVCGTSENLITGLIKLNSENLSELYPPKLYVFWNYSHPTLIERINALNSVDL